jgi:dihydroxyacid dehydratase/phosphogluconate dehydratase
MRLPSSIQAAMDKPAGRRFRSREWFADPHRSDMTALYVERFMNYGLTPEELRSGRPSGGIAQTGSDLSPCNRIHLELAGRVRDGIRGDVLRIDLNQARCDAQVSADEIARRLRELPAPPVPPSQSPWEELYRAHTGQLVDGATLDLALKHRRIAEHTPRHNH